MLSKIRLLAKSGYLLDALKSCCDDVQISASWHHAEVHTIHVSAKHEGKSLNAWGADKNESIALAKSLVELGERIHLKHTPNHWVNQSTGEIRTHYDLQNQWPILSNFMQTTSGMAAHFDRLEAQKNALNEMIERHVITKAMLEGIKAKAISKNTFIWQGPLETFVALIRHDTGNCRFVYGTAASKCASSAIEGAKREISALIHWSQNVANVNHLINTSVANRPSEIQAYHLSETHEISALNSSCTKATPISTEITSNDIWMADITPHQSFLNLGLKITRAFSPRMQPLYFGKLAEGPINQIAVDLNRLNIQAEYNVVA